MLIKLAAKYSPSTDIANKYGEEGLKVFQMLLHQKNGNHGLARYMFNKLDLPLVTKKIPKVVKDIQKAKHPPLFLMD